MMEFETWDRDTLIKEVKTAMMLASFQSFGSFLGTPIKSKIYTDEELDEKTNYDLQCIYVQCKRNDNVFRQAYEESEEKKRFFNQTTCNADFDYWSKQAYWSIDEAIALAFGKEPRKVTWESIKPHLSISPFAKKFNEIREMTRRYVCCKELFDPVFPGIFLAWAERMSLSIPDELKNAVSTIGIQVADWKSNYEKMVAQNNQLNQLYDEALDLIKIKEEIITTLDLQISGKEETIEVLNLQIYGHEPPQENSGEDILKETERQSLYKILSAMAYEGYGYNPTAKKSPLPKEISDAVTSRLGEKIDTDTTRKWLKKATDQYPDLIQSKTESIS